jgi:hypothetical protein
MTGCNELRNELKADGASGTRNKNSHGVILTFITTARQVVEANVNSSGGMWRRRKPAQCGTQIRPGPMIAGQPMMRDRIGLENVPVPMARHAPTKPCPNKKGALSARLKCFSGNDPLSES